MHPPCTHDVPAAPTVPTVPTVCPPCAHRVPVIPAAFENIGVLMTSNNRRKSILFDLNVFWHQHRSHVQLLRPQELEPVMSEVTRIEIAMPVPAYPILKNQNVRSSPGMVR